MNWRDCALILAGVIGSGVAVVHGLIVQRHMVRPIEQIFLNQKPTAGSIRRITPWLLQFSTFNWLIGGFALVGAGIGFPPGARLATAALVGSSYFYGAAINLWASRGRHPGWGLYVIALSLIAFGAKAPIG